jgi:hypothetical protein
VTRAANYLELAERATVVPNVSRVGLLGNAASPTYAGVRQGAQNAAQKVGLTVISVDARDLQEIETAFAAFAKERVEAFIVAGGLLTFGLVLLFFVPALPDVRSSQAQTRGPNSFSDQKFASMP